MKKSEAPAISVITLIIMFFGTVFAFTVWRVYFEVSIALVWAICIAVLFLCEFLAGLVKKRFSKNVGAFIASSIMGAVFAAAFIQSAPRGSSGLFPGLDGIGQAIACIAFLPPMIVSLLMNIGNVIYKVTCEKANRPNDPQP